ncbi:MAG: hypothetical protein IAE79_24530 [Anaerolinea sp.]|nr:hypothetical protein [Anaerolinea sp.]
MDAEKLRLAQTIDTWVQDIVRRSNSDDQADEQILESMIDYMGPFKQLLDTCTNARSDSEMVRLAETGHVN